MTSEIFGIVTLIFGRLARKFLEVWGPPDQQGCQSVQQSKQTSRLCPHLVSMTNYVGHRSPMGGVTRSKVRQFFLGIWGQWGRALTHLSIRKSVLFPTSTSGKLQCECVK